MCWKILTLFLVLLAILIVQTEMPEFLQHSPLQHLQQLRPVSYAFLYNFASGVLFDHRETLRTKYGMNAKY